ncbi:MAG: hypothetical protein AAF587_32975, partial [Bacteroidota bacterium]
TFVDKDGNVLEHRDDGDFSIYQVDNVFAWLAGGKKKEGLETVGVENPAYTYRKGQQIDLMNREHNVIAPQNGALIPNYTIEGLIIPIPFVAGIMGAGFRWLYIGGKWVFGRVYKVGGKYFLKIFGKGSNRIVSEGVTISGAKLNEIAFTKLQKIVRSQSDEMNAYFKSGGNKVPSRKALLAYKELTERILYQRGGAPAKKLTKVSKRVQTQRLILINRTLTGL